MFHVLRDDYCYKLLVCWVKKRGTEGEGEQNNKGYLEVRMHATLFLG